VRTARSKDVSSHRRIPLPAICSLSGSSIQPSRRSTTCGTPTRRDINMPARCGDSGGLVETMMEDRAAAPLTRLFIAHATDHGIAVSGTSKFRAATYLTLPSCRARTAFVPIRSGAPHDRNGSGTCRYSRGGGWLTCGSASAPTTVTPKPASASQLQNRRARRSAR